MKIGISFCLILCSILTYGGSKIDFYQGSAESAFQKAKEENKLIFVDFYASWCKPCKQLERHTFKNKKLAKKLNENYISLKIDVDHPDPFFKELMKNKIQSIPYLAFFTPEQQQIGVIKGFVEADELNDYVNSLQQHFEEGTNKKVMLEEKAETIALGLCEDLDGFTKLVMELNEVEEGSEAFEKLFSNFDNALFDAKKVFKGLDQKIGSDGGNQYFVDYLGKSLEKHCVNTMMVMQMLVE